MSVKVSVAMATYNGSKYVAEQLKSIFEQTRPPDEIIVCDDGSTDDTLKVVRHVSANTHITVKIFVNERKLGYAQNFSKALKICSGDYVFLSDQDDVWLPEKIGRVLGYFDQHPDLQLLIHDVEYCRDDLTLIGQTKIQRIEGVRDLENKYVMGMATAIRGSFLKLCLPVPAIEGVAHDNWLHDCAISIGCKGILREVLGLYRRHDTTATGAGRLNVDFVTTPRYYKRKLLPYLWGLVAESSDLGSPEQSLVLKWLQENEIALMTREIATRQVIDARVEEELMRIACVQRRQWILRQSRFKRVLPIFSFYKSGGYAKFLGWKSALKDFLLN